MVGQRHRLVDRQRLGQGLGRPSGRARPRPGCWPPGRRAPASGRSPARPTARSRCCAAPGLRHAAARPSGARGASARRAGECRRVACAGLQALQGFAIHRQRARRESAFDFQVLQVAAQLRIDVGRLRCHRRACAQGAGSRRDSAALASSPMRLQELGAHVGGVARRVGRGEHEQAEGLGAGVAWRSGIIAIDITRRRLVQPLHRLEAGVHAAVRAASGCWRRLFTSALTPCANGSADERRRRTPQAQAGLRHR